MKRLCLTLSTILILNTSLKAQQTPDNTNYGISQRNFISNDIACYVKANPQERKWNLEKLPAKQADDRAEKLYERSGMDMPALLSIARGYFEIATDITKIRRFFDSYTRYTMTLNGSTANIFAQNIGQYNRMNDYGVYLEINIPY